MNLSINKTNEQQYLFNMLLGPIRWNILAFAFHHRLFDHFITMADATTVAQQFNWCPTRLTLLLNSYVSLGIMEKQAQSFFIKSNYQPYLLSHSQHYLGETLCSLAEIKSLTLTKSAEWLVQNTQPKQQMDMHDQRFWQKATSRLRAFHRSTRNPILLSILQSLDNWQDGLHFLDVGAGSAELAQNILAIHPQSKITLFDLPLCCTAIQMQLIDSDGFDESNPSQSIKFLPGDMNTTLFGGPYQIIVAAMSLYFATNLQDCINRLWASLFPGGTLISFHESLNQERTQPEFHVLGRLPAELANGPFSIESEQIEEALKANHPSRLDTRKIPTPFGEMTLIIAHKCI
ncbi:MULTISPECIES: trans-aconitate 2-methyltransferase [Xenorhabdus]|uniref:class I SAM-dependent methyltransferase n=1 Tax=Xenorhabdus TaxID=626 RepID=UPI0006918723|nr:MULTISPECIES: class I SAM-dependent methyltransferase [Xenorhabdus]